MKFTVIFSLCLLANGCFLIRSQPEVQIRKELERSKTIGKVTFNRVSFKGVYQVNLKDETALEDVRKIADEIIEKYDVALVKPPSGVSNPLNRIFWIEKVSDETALEIGQDERIKFMEQYYTSH